MATIIALFNLKDGVDAAAYEQWARETDVPLVRAMDSCVGFEAFRTRHVLGTGEPAPYQYVEVIRVTDLEAFEHELREDRLRRVTEAFDAFAQDPVFLVADALLG